MKVPMALGKLTQFTERLPFPRRPFRRGFRTMARGH
jgi:hypothetical protein